MGELEPVPQDYRVEHAIGMAAIVLSRSQYVMAFVECLVERPGQAAMLGLFGVGTNLIGHHFRSQGPPTT